MKTRKKLRHISAITIFLVMFISDSCDTISSCWVCENPYNVNEWQEVCNTSSKNKLESYGYICSQE